MQTLEEQFNSRVSAFRTRTRVSPTTLGMKAVGDPNLMRQIDAGRSPSLRTADRILAFIAACELDPGAAPAARRPPGRPRPSARAGRTSRSRTMTEQRRGTNRSRAMTEQPGGRRRRPRIRLLRISAVEARTGLSRSTIYEWSADGRFPPPVRLSARIVRWVESEVEQWIRDRVAESRAGDAAAARH